MRVPVAWLREYCSPDLSTAEIAERFDLTGTEIARIERVGVGDESGFVVGQVLEAEPHPDADRLTVCKVDVGAGEPEQIVCGAPNVAAGQIVAVARPGAVMPDGTKLGKAKLRGVESSGMILAEDEVGISEEHSQTMVLDGDLTPGEPLAPHLPIADEVIELEITPNRPDCLAIYGIARELHAATGAPLAPDPTEEDVTSNEQRATSNRRPSNDRNRAPGDLPALHGPRVRGRQGRPVAAVAQAAPDRRRPAPDLERRRHHELRDAPDRPACPCVRPRRGARQQDHRAARRAGREDDDSRRH